MPGLVNFSSFLNADPPPPLSALVALLQSSVLTERGVGIGVVLWWLLASPRRGSARGFGRVSYPHLPSPLRVKLPPPRDQKATEMA
jgi:hypothetical protein